jgi:hypothetical protein
VYRPWQDSLVVLALDRVEARAHRERLARASLAQRKIKIIPNTV